MIVLVCSERARPPRVMFQVVETSTWTNEEPRSVAVEFSVTVPCGVRVSWVTPLAVGKARSFTVSVALLQKSELFAAVAIRFCRYELLVRSLKARLRNFSQRSCTL